MAIEKVSSGMAYQGSAASIAIQTESAAAVSEEAAKPTEQVAAPEKQAGAGQDSTQEKQAGETGGEDRPSQTLQLKNAVNDLNRRMTESEAVFGIHDKTNRVTIKIVDKTTKEVIKEYPPEQTLDMIAKVWEIAGILVDEKR